MFSLKTIIIIATATLTVLPFTSARIYNMTAPTTAAAGSNITAVLYTEDYIQNWNDFGVCPNLLQPF